MRLIPPVAGILLIGMTLQAGAASKARSPHMGYLYPAGARQGTTVQITAGGQYLNGADQVFITGEGVQATIHEVIKPFNNQQVRRFQQMLAKVIKKAQQPGKSPRAKTPEDIVDALRDAAGQNQDMLAVLDHPMTKHIGNLNWEELKTLVDRYKKQPPGAQLAELVILEVAIDPQAAPGLRELRIATAAGLTNPMRFEIGLLPETSEMEPNDEEAGLPPVTPPVLLNGQIFPGDIDQFRIQALCGQQLVVQAKARHLIPYLADAVPGWFQATLALYDAQGREIAFADDYLFDPDPVLFYTIPEDGEYRLEIRDAIYRGREDFVYRIAVAETPFITHMFPLGAPSGEKKTAEVQGWNLAHHRVLLDTGPGDETVRFASFPLGKAYSNLVPYAVDDLPECMEDESKHASDTAQDIDLPRIINGRIQHADDRDLFRFNAKAGQEIAAEVYARRLHSPLDSLLRITDAAGNVLAWNDDTEDRSMGLFTHHADSFVSFQAPAEGAYCVEISDAQQHGDISYAYRLRVGPPKPDFALRVTPSSVMAPAGRTVPIRLHALRKEGFTGDIIVTLKNAPPGFKLAGATIPAHRDCVNVTLTAPKEGASSPFNLEMEGRAEIAGKTLCHLVVPAEDMMQAFFYQHLVPSQQWLVSVPARKQPAPAVRVANPIPLQLTPGGLTQIHLKLPKRPKKTLDLQWALWDPPKGITLTDARESPDGFDLTLDTASDKNLGGYRDNLIIEAFVEREAINKSGKKSSQKQRVSLGVLPAIPCVIQEP